MKITQESISDLNLLLNLTIEPEDYQPELNSELKSIRKDAQFKGFRKGQVPVGLLRKMYGEKILIDRINKVLGESLNNYIKEKELKVFMEPIPADKEQKLLLQPSQAKNYEFAFEVALKPNITVNAKDCTVEQMEIVISEDDVNEHVANLRTRFGQRVDAEDLIQDKDMLNVTFIEVNEEGEAVEDGINKETALFVEYFNEDVQDELLDMKAGDSRNIKPFDDLKKDEDAVASVVLGIKEVVDMEALQAKSFKMNIDKVSRMAPASLDADFFGKLFPQEDLESTGVITEQDFRTRIKEEMSKAYKEATNNRFYEDIRTALISNVSMELPTDFLKKYLLLQNKETTPEILEVEYPTVEESIKWSLIRNQISEDHKIELSPEQVEDKALEDIQNYFQKSMGYIPLDADYDPLVKQQLQNEEYRTKLVTNMVEEKVMDVLKKEVSVTEKQMPLADFIKLTEKERDEANEKAKAIREAAENKAVTADVE